MESSHEVEDSSSLQTGLDEVINRTKLSDALQKVTDPVVSAKTEKELKRVTKTKAKSAHKSSQTSSETKASMLDELCADESVEKAKSAPKGKKKAASTKKSSVSDSSDLSNAKDSVNPHSLLDLVPDPEDIEFIANRTNAIPVIKVPDFELESDAKSEETKKGKDKASEGVWDNITLDNKPKRLRSRAATSTLGKRVAVDLTRHADPILKWPGGKRKMLKNLIPRMPRRYERFIEPFFGGGAFYFAINPKEAIVSDINPELINLYKNVAHNLKDVIEVLRTFKNTEDDFYEVRAKHWEDIDPIEAAARTIYLNRTCFNGLYRVNSKGVFNSPYGFYRNPMICDVEGLSAASEMLSRATIVCDSYINVIKEYASPDDFIFLDPPYDVEPNKKNFIRYSKDYYGGVKDQVEIANVFADLSDRGYKVILTNANTERVHKLFSGFEVEEVSVARSINAIGCDRMGSDVIVYSERLRMNPRNGRRFGRPLTLEDIID